jgi:ankyrin repeat protein
MVAVWYECIEVVKLFIEYGVNIGAKDNDGWDALMVSADNGYYQLTKLLLEHGADPTAKSDNGWDAMMYADDNGYPEVVKLLKSSRPCNKLKKQVK